MRSGIAFVIGAALGVCALAQSGGSNPFVGRWDFDRPDLKGVGANWLGISEKDGKLDVWFQPTGGHVHPVDDVKQDGSHLTLVVSPATAHHAASVWELTAEDGKLTGTEKTGDKSANVTGVPAPALDHPPVKNWTKPVALFDGKDLNGWEPIGNPANSHWVVKDGELVNEQHGDNLKSVRQFEDFKAHFEVNCPDKANSGFYLRGRYELQLEYEPADTEPLNRQMGAIYGRIAPSVQLPRKPGEWESFDVELVGRNVTVVRDGTMIIDHKQIDGITGGALNADEGKPGPFYIQGDHTGGLMFRNITVSVPKS